MSQTGHDPHGCNPVTNQRDYTGHDLVINTDNSNQLTSVN